MDLTPLRRRLELEPNMVDEAIAARLHNLAGRGMSL